MKYDVFLSKNTKDILEAKKLVDFLENVGLKVFESTKSLPNYGSSDYAMAIDEALEKSEHLIVLCSLNEFGTGEDADSKWVYYEWTTFRNELLSKRKTGNLITVLCDGVELNMLPIGLRKYEFFKLSEIENSSILNYLRNNNIDKQEQSSKSNQRNSSVNNLKFFDFGYHFALNMFAKMQNKDDFSELLQKDINTFDKLLWKNSDELMSIGPDNVVKEVKSKYGNIAADIFEFGQYCGISTTMALFIVKGANIMEQFEMTFNSFLLKAKSLGIQTDCVEILLDLVKKKDEVEISNFYKVVRHAISM